MRRLRELASMTGRRAIVTGGAGHIGRAICEALLEEGATVCVADRDADACAARVKELEAHGDGRPMSLSIDLSDERSTRRAIRDGIARMGGLDVLVHSAAFVGTTQMPGWAVPLDDQTVEAWDAAMRVNLTSVLVMAQEAREALAADGRGSIVLVSSIYGLVAPDPGLYAGTSMANPAAYGASKAGLLQLTRHLATHLAPRIRVNAITPGGILRGQPAVFQERYVSRTPLRRMGREEDVKGAVALLASDLSSYMTGQNIVVDGGWTTW